MKYLSGNQPSSIYVHVVPLWHYTLNDKLLISAIKKNYKKPENWQFIQPMFL